MNKEALNRRLQGITADERFIARPDSLEDLLGEQSDEQPSEPYHVPVTETDKWQNRRERRALERRLKKEFKRKRR